MGLPCSPPSLYSGQVTHGDLKPGNLLADENLKLHISDFGLASMKVRALNEGRAKGALEGVRMLLRGGALWGALAGEEGKGR